MKLIVDIGNTFAKTAIFDGEEIVEMRTTPNNDLSPMLELCKKYSPAGGIISSVVTLSEGTKSVLDCLNIPLIKLNGNTPLPIRICYSTPETLGADRIAAAVGANHLLPDKDLLVIDAGTCITYEFVDAGGCYRGGNISPGLQMRLKALHQFTGKLPLVTSEGEMPDWGNSTETAIRAGVVNGMKYEIEGYINELKAKYPNLLVFLTGGDKFSFDEKIKSIIFADRFLVLKGLNRILNYNNGRI